MSRQIARQVWTAKVVSPDLERLADINEEETALAENATMTNQTTSGNMTGTNSTS